MVHGILLKITADQPNTNTYIKYLETMEKFINNKYVTIIFWLCMFSHIEAIENPFSKNGTVEISFKKSQSFTFSTGDRLLQSNNIYHSINLKTRLKKGELAHVTGR